jgi:hypothetical protein
MYDPFWRPCRAGSVEKIKALVPFNPYILEFFRHLLDDVLNDRLTSKQPRGGTFRQ